jgi:hypothetical protein
MGLRIPDVCLESTWWMVAPSALCRIPTKSMPAALRWQLGGCWRQARVVNAIFDISRLDGNLS